MADEACTHADEVPGAAPETDEGCQDCLEAGRQDWVEPGRSAQAPEGRALPRVSPDPPIRAAVRVCQTCGHVGCCGSSPGDHASRHHEETGHPVIEPPAGEWAWRYEHEAYVKGPPHPILPGQGEGGAPAPR